MRKLITVLCVVLSAGVCFAAQEEKNVIKMSLRFLAKRTSPSLLLRVRLLA